MTLTFMPLKPAVKYEDFAKLDLRVGTVESYEDVENSEKLIKLTVNIGLNTRQILAGIKDSVSKEELLGKQIVVVANLEARKMAGLESQGMILAADVDGKAIIIAPNSELENGTVVR